jgi:hypothetical protein
MVGALLSLRRTWGVIALGAAFAVVPASAHAGHNYWDFHDWLDPDEQYVEGPLSQAADWAIRLNRSSCDAKMSVYDSLTGWNQITIPGGCSNNDHTHWFYTSISFAPWYARSKNKGEQSGLGERSNRANHVA